MRNISPNANVDPACELADDIEIGPGCSVGPKVVLGPGCRLMPNVVIMGNTAIGARNVFCPGCVIGAPPQDLKHAGEDTRLLIGDDNIFREMVTVHTGTTLGGGVTTIGHRNQFQVGSHIAHDVTVGNHCVLSNQVQVAGHVYFEDCVNVSGLVGIQQFVTLGRNSFIVGFARCTTDVPPFLIYDGAPTGVNAKGLVRWGFTEKQTEALRALYRQLFPRRGRDESNGGLRNLAGMLFSRRARRSARSLSRRIREVESNGPLDEHGTYLVEFLKRSLHDGVFGRYRESQRRDQGLPPPKFYAPQPAEPEPVS